MSMFGGARERIVNFLVGDTRIPSKQDIARSHMMPDVQVGLGDSEIYNLYDWFQDNTSIERDLTSRYLDYERMDDYPDAACLEGSTLVYTFWGPLSIQWLAENRADDQVPVLSYNAVESRFEFAWGHSPRRTIKDAPVFRVVFDDGSVLVGTEDHPVMLFDGTYHPLSELRPGMSVRPMFARADKQGYLSVMQPRMSGRHTAWEPVHRIAGRGLWGSRALRGKVVHHRDGNPLNNDPVNLELLTNSEHSRRHIEDGSHVVEWTPERRAAVSRRMIGNRHRAGATMSEDQKNKIGAAIRGKKQRPDWVERRIAPLRKTIPEDEVCAAADGAGSVLQVSDRLGVSWKVAKRHLDALGIAFDVGVPVEQSVSAPERRVARQVAVKNHKVVSVEPWGSTDVYDLTVPGHDNFVANGIVVHNSALDTYADEATQSDQMKNLAIWFESSSDAIQKRGMQILKNMGVEDDLWAHTRGLCKYGNEYGELIINQEGIQGIEYMDPPTVRVASVRGKVVGYVQDVTGKFSVDVRSFQTAVQNGTYEQGHMVFFEPWEVVHWKLMLRRLRGLYGHGILEPVRWLHKRLLMLEDSAILFKITRAPVRLAYYVACGDIPAERRIGYVTQIKQMFRRKKFKDADGKLRFSFDPRNPLEEFWLPSGGDHGDTRIETIGGSDYQSNELLEYLQDKYANAIKVPRFQAGSDARTSLANQDVRFARAILRVQRAECVGWERVLDTDLMARNIDPRTIDRKAVMTVPSSIFELARMEVWNARADLMTRIEMWMPVKWMLVNIVRMSDKAADELMKVKAEERRGTMIGDAAAQAKVDKIIQGNVPQEGTYLNRQELGRLIVQSIAQEPDLPDLDEKRLIAKIEEAVALDPALAQRLDSMASMVRDLHHVAMSGIARGHRGGPARR